MCPDNKAIIPQFCEAATLMETEHRATEILAHAVSNASKNTPSGFTSPVVFLSDCSEEEQGVVRDFFTRQREDAIALAQLDDYPQSPNPQAPTSQFSLLPKPACISSLSELLGHTPANASSTVSPYTLMCKLLGHCVLRWYDKRFYCLSGGVYHAISDIKAFVMWALEADLAQGKTNQLLRNIVELLECNQHIRANEAQLPPHEIPFLNGIFNLESQRLRPTTYTDFFINHIAVPYPETPLDCPTFDHFLDTISGGDNRIVEAIWEMVGYLLTADMTGKAFFILQGVGDSGKSVLGNLIASFFNPEAVSHLDIFRLGDRFSTSALQGRLLNVCMDLPDGKIRKEAAGTIKQITGGDGIEIEGKFRDPQSLRPTCKLLFGTNFPIRIESDAAFENRCAIIPFSYAIPKEHQDKYLLETLLQERSAIAARALEAYQRLRRRNYQFINLGTNAAFAGWVPLTQQLEEFLAACCEFGSGTRFHTSTADLFSCFNIFCQAAGRVGCTDMTQFSRQLNQLCRGRILPKKKRGPTGNLNGYDGIALRDTPTWGGDSHA